MSSNSNSNSNAAARRRRRHRRPHQYHIMVRVSVYDHITDRITYDVMNPRHRVCYAGEAVISPGMFQACALRVMQQTGRQLRSYQLKKLPSREEPDDELYVLDVGYPTPEDMRLRPDDDDNVLTLTFEV